MTSAPPPYDGCHVIADMHDCAAPLDDVAAIEAILRDAAAVAGATVIGVHLHHFGPQQGVTGVAILAESHMSIHTWPEHRYAAVDIFMCGSAHDIDAAVDMIGDRLLPEHMEQSEIARGFGAVTAG